MTNSLPVIAFNRGVPPPESFPKRLLADCAQHVLEKTGDILLQYGNSSGYPPLREWIAYRHHAISSNVIVGQGSLQLLDHFVHACLQPGDLVFVEQPSYDRVLNIFRRAGIHLKGYELINGCVDVLAIEEDLRKGIIPKYFYVIPDFQNPNGSSMPLDHRKRLLMLADEFDFKLIEDGPYRHLRYTGVDLPSLYEMDAGHVIHMSSFSKLISPGLRVGYLVGQADLIERAVKRAEDTYISPSYLDQAIVLEFIQRGLMDEHVVQLRNLYRPKLRAMLSALEDYLGEHIEWVVPEGGFFVGAFLKPAFEIQRDLILKRKGIQLSDSRGFFLKGGEQFIRLPFCALTPVQIREGIARLKSFFEE